MTSVVAWLQTAAGTVKLSYLGGPRTMLAQSSNCGSNPANVGPHLERTRPCGSILAGGDVVAAEMEEVGDLVVGGEETLCLPRRLEALHLSFASSGRLVRILGSVIQALVLSVLSAGRDRLLCSP